MKQINKKTMKTKKILNVWNSNKIEKKYYQVEKPIFQKNEYSIFKIGVNSYLYTFQDISITNLCGVNKDLINSLINDLRPLENNRYNPQTFLFDRCKENLKKGIELKN